MTDSDVRVKMADLLNEIRDCRDDELIIGTLCWCNCGTSCEVIARYLWIPAKSGNRILLCAACCANWRARAEREPDLAPARIQLLGNAKWGPVR
jgi:hypothetical protein